jgi:hypothetical protein
MCNHNTIIIIFIMMFAIHANFDLHAHANTDLHAHHGMYQAICVVLIGGLQEAEKGLDVQTEGYSLQASACNTFL